MSDYFGYSPFSNDGDEEEEEIDQLFDEAPRGKYGKKLAADRLNFVALCDSFPLMDPKNLLDAFNACDRDLEHSINFVSEMTDVEAARIGIIEEKKIESSTIPCSFFELNKFCSFGCPYYHDYLGVRCPYYDPKTRVCPYGKDCIFLHRTEEEQRMRLDAAAARNSGEAPEEEDDEDGVEIFDNTHFCAPHVVDFTPEQEDYLYELYDSFEFVPTVIINAVLHFIVLKKIEMSVAHEILTKYFSVKSEKDKEITDTPKWPESLFTRNEGLAARYNETFKTARMLSAMRNIHIEQGIEAHVYRKKTQTARRHMRSAWAYQVKLSNYVGGVSAALFSPPRRGFLSTVDLAPYVTSRKDTVLDYSSLAAVDIKSSILRTPTRENNAIYFFNDSGEERMKIFEEIIRGSAFKSGSGMLASLFISSDRKVAYAFFDYSEKKK